MQIIAANKLNKRIADVRKSATNLNKNIHEVAYSCLDHVANHGDPRPLTALYDALGTRALQEALVAWSKAFGMVQFDDTKGVFKYDAKATSNLTGSGEVSPLSYKTPAKPTADYDFAKKLQAFLKDAEKHNVPTDPKLSTAYLDMVKALEKLNGGNVVTAPTSQAPKAKAPKVAKAA